MRFVKGLTAFAVLLFAATGIQSPAVAATFNVTDVAGLRAALLAAATNGEDDVIVLAAGTYATGGTTFIFATNENNSMTLRGANGATRSQVILDGGGTSQVLNFSCIGSCGPLTLQGLTVLNGNAAASGGGVNAASANLTLADVSFSGNNATNSGGAISGASVTVTNSSFSNNKARLGGGAIAASGTVTDSSFSNNTVTDGSGGAISGPVSVTNSSFDGNTSGGGRCILLPFGYLPTEGGGAIFRAITVANSSFSNNKSSCLGGALDFVSTVTNSSFSNNTASWGGGAIFGAGTVSNSTFFDNTADRSGGAIDGYGHVTVINSIFSNNKAGFDGGAIDNGNITIINSIFSNNKAGLGGGAMAGHSIVINSSFSGNSAVGSGAAIALPARRAPIVHSIINSVFYGHDKPAIYGSLIYNPYNNTIEDNLIYLYYNLIDAGTDVAGMFPLMGNNVAPGATSPFVDAANGNFQLVAGSPAINAGLDPSSATFANLVGSSAASIRQLLLTDLQGNPRPTPGTAVDMGAYESANTTASLNAPTIIGVSGNYGTATVSFLPATPFTNYAVTCTAAGQTVRTATGTNSPITVQGLIGGVIYSCELMGINSIAPSAPSVAVTVKPNSVVPMMMQLLFE